MGAQVPDGRRRSRRRQRGAAAVEFALISMIFIPMIFAMMGFGLILWAHQAADNAAREGARLAAVGVSTGGCGAWEDTVKQRGAGIAQATFVVNDATTDGGNGDSIKDAGDQVAVTLEYSVPGAPAWMLRAASQILPGPGTINLPDGSGTALQDVAYSRNEVSFAGTPAPFTDCPTP